MRNFVQTGDVLTLIVPQGGVSSGQPIMVGSIFGIAAHDALEHSEVEAQLVGVFELPKQAGAIAQGAKVYYENGPPGVVTTTATDNTLIGVATEAAATDDPTVRVRLNGISI